MVAIHGLDNSIENLIRIVADHLDIEGTEGSFDSKDLGGLAGEVNRYLKDNYGASLPYLSEIKRIRQVRNLVQHGALDPGPDMAQHRRITKRFYQRVYKEIFGLELDQVLLSSLIGDEEISKIMQDSARLISEKKYLKSIVQSRDAFDNGRYKYKGRRIREVPLLFSSTGQSVSPYAKYVFKNLSDDLFAMRLGIDARSWEKYNEYISHIPGEYRSYVEWGWKVMQRKWTKEDAEFCHRFVVESLVKLENNEIEPLYQKRSLEVQQSEYRFEIHLGGIRFGDNQMYWDSGLSDVIEVFTVETNIVDEYKAIKKGSEYEHASNRYKDGEIVWSRTKRIRVIDKSWDLKTHYPPRWELAIRYVELNEAHTDHEEE